MVKRVNGVDAKVRVLAIGHGRRFECSQIVEADKSDCDGEWNVFPNVSSFWSSSFHILHYQRINEYLFSIFVNNSNYIQRTKRNIKVQIMCKWRVILYECFLKLRYTQIVYFVKRRFRIWILFDYYLIKWLLYTWLKVKYIS